MTLIAEIGQNHLGKMTLARTLIKLAKENGADLAKFQLYDTDALYEKGTELYHQAKEAELTFDQAKILFDYGEEVAIEVFFSVFDVEKVEWCERIGVKRYKVAAKIKEYNLFQALSLTKKEVIISWDEKYPREYTINIGRYASALVPMPYLKAKNLYCISKYPTEMSDLSFGKNGFGDDCDKYDEHYDGFSDHTIGLDAAKIALARGAEIIEKHFCLSHYVGVDGMWSMTPEELRELKRWERVCQEVL